MKCQKPNHMTEQDIKDLGFILERGYEHDQYRTLRYVKGVLEVEFTYEGDRLENVSLTIEEVNCIDVSLEMLSALTPIFGNNQTQYN